MGHKFKIGQLVNYINRDATSGVYEVSQLLPPENWGFPATQIFLGSQFDSIKSFWFTAENPIDCFGMDTFFINEPAPPQAPEPGTVALLGLGLGGLVWWRRSRA